jgi:hypothetical protein
MGCARRPTTPCPSGDKDSGGQGFLPFFFCAVDPFGSLVKPTHTSEKCIINYQLRISG